MTGRVEDAALRHQYLRQTVMRLRIAFSDRQRAAEVIRGFFNAPLVREKPPEIVVSLGVLRINLKGASKVNRSLVELTCRHQQRSKIVVCVRVVRGKPQRLPILTDRLVPLSRSDQSGPQIEVRRRDIGRQPRRFREMIDGIARAPHREIEQRHVVVQRDVAGRTPQHRLVPQDVFAKDLLSELTDQHVEIRARPRHDLDPEIAHLVRGILSPAHSLRRTLRIAPVRLRVVVRVPHRQRRASGQRDGLDVAVRVLPVEIPIADVNQPYRRSVRQRRKALDVRRAVMRVRLHAVHLDVDRQHIGVRSLVIVLAGRDVDVLFAEAQHGGTQARRSRRKVQADSRLHALGLPRRSQVELKHEVGAGVQPPRQIL